MSRVFSKVVDDQHPALIPVNAERLSDQEHLAKQLAQRVLSAQPMQRPDQLPYLVALAAQAMMGMSG